MIGRLVALPVPLLFFEAFLRRGALREGFLTMSGRDEADHPYIVGDMQRVFYSLIILAFGMYTQPYAAQTQRVDRQQHIFGRGGAVLHQEFLVVGLKRVAVCAGDNAQRGRL